MKLRIKLEEDGVWRPLVARQSVKHPGTDAEGNIIWKNMLRPHWPGLIALFLILVIAWSYSHDTDVCREIIEEPQVYCSEYCEAMQLRRWVGSQEVDGSDDGGWRRSSFVNISHTPAPPPGR